MRSCLTIGRFLFIIDVVDGDVVIVAIRKVLLILERLRYG